MSVALALILSALAMTFIVGVRYLLASGGFALATRLRHPGLYRGLDQQMRREIGWSLASAAIYGVPAGLVAWGWSNRGWTLIYFESELARYVAKHGLTPEARRLFAQPPVPAATLQSVSTKLKRCGPPRPCRGAAPPPGDTAAVPETIAKTRTAG